MTDLKITFTADPAGGGMTYDWQVEGGTIKSGDKTSSIVVGDIPGNYVRAKVAKQGCGNYSEFCETQIIAAPLQCPTVSVSCPREVQEGQPVSFTAIVTGGDPDATPTFNWTISAGTISRGQGMSSITVDANGLGTQTVTATVEVGGFGGLCSITASCTTQVTAQPRARKIDEIVGVISNEENARLDNLAIELQNNPSVTGYVITYGGRRGRPGEARRVADSVRNRLVVERGTDAERITTVNGGYREDLTVELWLVPAGASPPKPSPTVAPGEVQNITRRARRAAARPRPGAGRRPQ